VSDLSYGFVCLILPAPAETTVNIFAKEKSS